MNNAVNVVVSHDFERVYLAVFPRLVSFGVIKTGRVDVARELAQETMLRAHAHWDEVANYDRPEAWCHVVMSNLLIDAHRSAAAEQRALQRAHERPLPHESPPGLERWNELIAPLTDRQRLVLTLFYAQDMSVDAIAQAIGSSTGGVKAALFKARRTLRQRLRTEGEP